MSSALKPGGSTSEWRRIRLAVLRRDGHACQMCGSGTQLQVDHIVPRQDGGTDAMDNLRTLCWPCHKRVSKSQTKPSSNDQPARLFPEASDTQAPTVFFPPRALTGQEPAGEPRFFPDPHPEAVGSHGPALESYAGDVLGEPLRPWQASVVERALEYDVDGLWCWRSVLVVVPRQSGKSTILRALAAWLADTRGQYVLTTSNRLRNLAELHEPIRAWAHDRDDITVKRSVDEPRIVWPSGGMWVGMAPNGQFGRGRTVDALQVDEVQDVSYDAFTAASPAMSGADNPLRLMVGTAARGVAELLTHFRKIGLAEQDGPPRVALMEWSAPEGADHRDEEVWRACQPHWDKSRLQHMRDELALLDESSMRSEYLCQAVAGGPAPWINLATWAQLHSPDLDTPPAPDVVAIEEERTGGAAIARAWVLHDGRFAVHGQLVGSVSEAFAEATGAKLVLCGITLRSEPEAWQLAAHGRGMKETSMAMPNLRRLVESRGLVWNGEDLDKQVRTLVARPSTAGTFTVAPHRPSSVARAAAWAVAELRETSADSVLVY